MDTTNVSQILLLALPIAIIELGLMVYAVVDLARKWKTKNLSPVAWLLIIILINIIGPILYLLIGRTDEE
ncbi:MAG: PLDc N-terminal domain-containing protein [Patescibacteria group bacterium]|jgi:hypothetical protein